MSGLARLQGDFQDYLLRGGAAVKAQVLGSVRVPIETRLGIYAGAYRGRLAEALESNFPALAKLLGAADFRTLAADYVRAHDSTRFSIRWYGDELPGFLSTHEDYVQAPVLAELARWEWTLGEVFDAADAPLLAHDSLAGIAPAQWAQLRFTFHPGVRRLSLVWNVPQIWQALTDGSERPAAALHPAPTEWLLWRSGLASYFRSVDATEAAVLDGALRGWPFAELCERLCAALGAAQAPARAAALLREWVGSGLISSAD
jgi:hypothetical protein